MYGSRKFTLKKGGILCPLCLMHSRGERRKKGLKIENYEAIKSNNNI